MAIGACNGIAVDSYGLNLLFKAIDLMYDHFRLADWGLVLPKFMDPTRRADDCIHVSFAPGKTLTIASFN